MMLMIPTWMTAGTRVMPRRAKGSTLALPDRPNPKTASTPESSSARVMPAREVRAPAYRR